MNKALAKVDEFMDKAHRKIDEIAANSFDEAFARFSERFNELQASTQNVDEIVQQTIDPASTEQVNEMQLPNNKVEEVVNRAVEKAFNQTFAKFSERFCELQSSITTQGNQQGAMKEEGAGTVVHSVVNELEDMSRHPMEIEEIGNVSDADTEEVDTDNENPSKDLCTCEYPCPGFTYMVEERESILFVNKYSRRFNQWSVDSMIPTSEIQYFHWQCRGGPSDCLYFVNEGTKKYIGIAPEQYHEGQPILDSKINIRGDNTRFYLRRMDGDSYLLQTRIDDRLFYVTVEGRYYSYGNRWEAPPRLVCKEQVEGNFTRWKFRRIQ